MPVYAVAIAAQEGDAWLCDVAEMMLEGGMLKLS